MSLKRKIKEWMIFTGTILLERPQENSPLDKPTYECQDCNHPYEGKRLKIRKPNCPKCGSKNTIILSRTLYELTKND